MKKFLFLFMLSGFFLACSNDDSNGDLPVKDVEIPKFENPVKPGESVTIKGEGFTSKSEIWFRALSGKSDVALSGDVKATVTEVTATGITFITPDVYGNQSVLLKEDGKEYLLGTMIFEQRSDGDENIEILPKRIKKIVVCSYEGPSKKYYTTYEFAYGNDKIISKKEIKEYDIRISNYTYNSDEIVVNVQESGYEADASLVLKDNKLSVYAIDEIEKGIYQSIYKYEYAYIGGYLNEVKGNEDGTIIEETFSFADGNLMVYNYKDDVGYSESFEYTYEKLPNNLNIDLFSILTSWYWATWTGEEPFLLGVAGGRSQCLPSSMKRTYEDDVDGDKRTMEYTINYKLDGKYITRMSIDRETERDLELQIFYED